MEAKELKPNVANQVHLSKIGAFTFFKDKIITASEDAMMKLF